MTMLHAPWACRITSKGRAPKRAAVAKPPSGYRRRARIHRDSAATGCSGTQITRCVIGLDSLCQIVLRGVSEHAAGFGQVGLRPVLREAVGVLEIVGREIGFQHAVELLDHLVER